MSEADVAWCVLPPAAIAHLFVGHRRRTFLACLLETNAVSVVDRREAISEFARLRVGRALFVRALWGDESSGCVVSSVRSGVMLWASDPGLEIDGSAVRMEVVERSFGPRRRLELVRHGTRPSCLDLPDWMFVEFPRPGEHRGTFARQLRLAAGGTEAGDTPDVEEAPLPNNLSDDDLDCIACRYLGRVFGDGAPSLTSFFVSRDWIQRRRQASEFPLLPALLAAATYAHAADADRQYLEEQMFIRGFLTEIGRRAVRSLHVEVIARDWLGRPDERREMVGLRRRLEEVFRSISATMGSNRKDSLTVPIIQAFRNAVELRDDESLRPLADALGAAEGNLADPRRLVERAELLAELACLDRPVNHTIPGSTKEERGILKRAIATVTAQGLDIVLLEPAPEVCWADDTE